MIDSNRVKVPRVPEEGQVLERFRSFASGHVADFLGARDRLTHLVGNEQPYAIGVAREDLLRGFLRRLLPKSLSVDSGVVYGFERVSNSSQIDVLVWDSANYPAVFQADSFVVVPPEAVVAAISVKSGANATDLRDSVKNLASLAPVEIEFRRPANCRPIFKAHFSYSSNAAAKTSVRHIVSATRSVLEEAADAGDLQHFLENLDPSTGTDAQEWFDRRLPKLYVYLGRFTRSVVRNLGPPNRTVEQALAERLRLRPWVYPQGDEYTSPLEKLGFYLLRAASSHLGRASWSLVSAWGDLDPRWHMRAGDIDEHVEEDGAAILPADWTAAVAP